MGEPVGTVRAWVWGRSVSCAAEWGGWQWHAEATNEADALRRLESRLSELDPFIGFNTDRGDPGQKIGDLDERSPKPVHPMQARQAFPFDLDGTLVDSVYQHVLAWRDALDETGIELSVWRIHRKIGMSGGLFVNALMRETGRALSAEDAARVRKLHGEAYRQRASQVRLLPGTRELLGYLSGVGVPWAVATSGYLESAGPTIELLGLPEGVPLVTRDQVAHAKPDPDLFLTAAERLGVDMADSVVVGDSVWDLLAHLDEVGVRVTP